MPHGTPDWGLVGPLPTFFGLDDLAEQAVRVGAVHSWNRIGHVVFSDDFSEGLGAWRLLPSDITATICPSTGSALSSPYCAKLVNGSAGIFNAEIRHYLGYRYRGICGLEFNVAIEEDTEYVEFGINSHLPAGRLLFSVRLIPSTGVLEYWIPVVLWTPFGNIGAVAGTIHEWHNVKLVIDFDTGLFVRIVWEGVVIDMAALAGAVRPPTAPYYWYVYIMNDSDTGDQYQIYADNVIVTVDEP